MSREIPIHRALEQTLIEDVISALLTVLPDSQILREAHTLQTRFTAVLETAPDAIVLVDSGGSIVLVNSEAERLFGYPRDELLGMTLDRLVPERLRRTHAIHRKGYFGDPRTRTMGSGLELLAVRKDGTEFAVEISLSPVETSDGTLVTAAIRDVSERKQREKANREVSEAELQREAAARRELQEFIDAMSTLNAKVATNGAILLANRSAQEASGLSMDELLKTSFADAGWWAWDAQVRANIVGAFREACSGTPVIREENLKLNGSVVPASISLVPVRQASGIVDYVIVEARNISSQVEAQRGLRAINEELEAFTYSVSHDLRAPLRQIEGFTEILRSHLGSDLDPEVAHSSNRIREGTRRMARLIDDLLNLSRVGRQGVEIRRTSLDSIIREVVNDLDADLAPRNIEWKIGRLPDSDCDPGLMRLAFVNLLSNASKYTRPREHALVEIGCFKRDGDVVYFVRDNGVGFDMKYADKLFGVFQRLHRPDQFEGTGVGLATVQRIIRKHGGEIWAEAKPDQGATFYFTLTAPGGGRSGGS